jgi:enoyl-CoA hydratase
MHFKDLLVEKEDKILIVKLNRPEVLNALRGDTFREIEHVLDDLSNLDEVRAMIITATGDRAFSAGGDVKSLLNMTRVEAAQFGNMTHRILNKIENTPKPIIAAVNGLALGAGCDLAVACDLIVASEKAVFGEPPTGLGIITPFGGTQRLPRILGPKRSKQLFFTGENIDAETAFRFGLVNNVVKHEELQGETRKLALKIIGRAPIAIGYCKQLINFSSYGNIEEGDRLEAELYAKCFDTEDRTEGMNAFLEKRLAHFRGR